MRNGTVTGPVVTPPESKAMARKSSGHERREHEQQQIKPCQQITESDTEQRAQRGQHQKRAHADGDRDDERRIDSLARFELSGQHLQIRLGDGNQHTHDETDEHDEPDFFGLGQRGTHRAAHRHHGDVRAQREQSHSQNEQHRAHGKQADDPPVDAADTERDDNDQHGDGQYRQHRLFQLFAQAVTQGHERVFCCLCRLSDHRASSVCCLLISGTRRQPQ